MNRRDALKAVLALAVTTPISSSLLAQAEEKNKSRQPAIRVTGPPDKKQVTVKVDGVDYGKYRIVLYICLSRGGGQWYVKPYGNAKKTKIGSNGKTKITYNTYSSDKNTKTFLVFLVKEKMKSSDIPETPYGYPFLLDGAVAYDVYER
ncbi:MAG: hypothetical protein NTY66_03330 [Candidatus Vogelbacteria bacterium]|nr:hypothetical protein [Candidatus Vogelbacteria bacterium]